ncbi:murein transglycosylase A [Crocinitomicaceae bacterium]|nr:murein transglycosylase A [Crocinitomicaceae bacterium]
MSIKLLTLSILMVLTMSVCGQSDGVQKVPVPSGLGHGYEFENNGKLIGAPKMKTVFEKDTSFKMVRVSNEEWLRKALGSNMNYLNRRGSASASPLSRPKYNYESLRKVNHFLQQRNLDSLNLSGLELQKVWGEDSCGNVFFTSYYTPIVEVSLTQDSIYKYPIYKKPSSAYLQKLSRHQIDSKLLLKNKNLEIGYAKNYWDVYSMQVQGSGYVQFKDGTKKLCAYGGNNNKAYLSIGKYLTGAGYIRKEDISMKSIREWFDANPDSLHILMKNASYVYFKETNKQPSGAANVPLVDFVSIACDFKYLPKGALLLGEIPVLDVEGKFLKHEFRILMVHDTGGAIKGPGHVDLYAGVGTSAGNYAGMMKHYGRLWLILP